MTESWISFKPLAWILHFGLKVLIFILPMLMTYLRAVARTNGLAVAWHKEAALHLGYSELFKLPEWSRRLLSTYVILTLVLAFSLPSIRVNQNTVVSLVTGAVVMKLVSEWAGILVWLLGPVADSTNTDSEPAIQATVISAVAAVAERPLLVLQTNPPMA